MNAAIVSRCKLGRKSIIKRCIDRKTDHRRSEGWKLSLNPFPWITDEVLNWEVFGQVLFLLIFGRFLNYEEPIVKNEILSSIWTFSFLSTTCFVLKKEMSLYYEYLLFSVVFFISEGRVPEKSSMRAQPVLSNSGPRPFREVKLEGQWGPSLGRTSGHCRG